jgi:tryptophan 2,3-dioxygenase
MTGTVGTAPPEEELTYATYLAVNELLELQRPRSRPEHPDELLFIVVHQSSELWFKVLLHELDFLIARLEAGDAMGALAMTRRLNALVRIVAAQLSALDTLPPQRFAQFRGYLGTASGGQSAQFRAIEAVSGLRDDHFMHVLREHGEPPDVVRRALERPTLQALFLDLLQHQGTTLETLYSDPQPTPLFLLAESLIEYEQGFQLWRYLHVQLVERIIGPEVGGTGGTLGARYLQRTLQQRFFPDLWSVRARFFTPDDAGDRNARA